MTEIPVLACTLSGSELVERIIEWGQVASHATRRHVEKGRITSTYPFDVELLQRLRNLIAAEAECCPFMQFSVQEGPDEVTVELRVPDDMSESLAIMLGLVTKQHGSAAQPASS